MIFSVVVKDAAGRIFSREWKATADRRDAIRWTLQSEDVPYYVDTMSIVSIEIIPEEETK